ncbi:hypothetical protein FHS26_004827 [Rhizobium pisi]|jgi:hypothetical protein|uniref:Uncharacterized protein n=1 Tax=Rhizobium pisi TaxID=574561 RepID=A0A7W5BS32_9HYPH|nr:hypothetical protein [Rhizobium pisi]MBB3137068.1 hypothetical protein [Rhizobium pisi]
MSSRSGADQRLRCAGGAHATRQAEALVYSNRAWHALGPVVDAASAPVLLWPDDSATF